MNKAQQHNAKFLVDNILVGRDQLIYLIQINIDGVNSFPWHVE